MVKRYLLILLMMSEACMGAEKEKVAAARAAGAKGPMSEAQVQACIQFRKWSQGDQILLMDAYQAYTNEQTPFSTYVITLLKMAPGALAQNSKLTSAWCFALDLALQDKTKNIVPTISLPQPAKSSCAAEVAAQGTAAIAVTLRPPPPPLPPRQGTLTRSGGAQMVQVLAADSAAVTVVANVAANSSAATSHTSATAGAVKPKRQASASVGAETFVGRSKTVASDDYLKRNSRRRSVGVEGGGGYCSAFPPQRDQDQKSAAASAAVVVLNPKVPATRAVAVASSFSSSSATSTSMPMAGAPAKK